MRKGRRRKKGQVIRKRRGVGREEENIEKGRKGGEGEEEQQQ